MDKTVLDTLLANHPLRCEVQPARVSPDDLVHVVGTQEPVRDQPDERARSLLAVGWLKVETVRIDLPEEQRSALVSALQQSARAWTKQSSSTAKASDREQVRWLVEKTRPHESKQQIAQRVWLAVVLYNLGYRGLAFDSEGQIHWEGGVTGRIGLSPDAAIDLAWEQPSHQIYVASFRQPDGTITRGKGRHRWYVYRLTVDPVAEFLFKRRQEQVTEEVALIVASETFATQPQLPRDFYGGDEFQQACIDAQDQQFDHILVLSPEHGVISLDDTVPSERLWDDVIERRIWAWQTRTIHRLGAYLFGPSPVTVPHESEMNWWAWLNPDSVYEITVFGAGFAVRVLLEYLLNARLRAPYSWPKVVLAEQRPGYDIGDIDDDFGMDFEPGDEYDDVDTEELMQDIDQLLDWAGELVTLITIYFPPTGETWELEADEAMIPVRLLSETGMDIEDMLDLLTDITLLLNEPLPITTLINAPMIVSMLLQITHNLVHDEREAIPEMLDTFNEGAIRRYIETVMQEPSLEDRLCGCLTLTEQLQLLAITISPSIRDQLLTWLQTHISIHMRQRILGNDKE